MAAVVACGPAPSTTVACEPSVSAAPSIENPTWLGDAAAPSASVSVTTHDECAGRLLIVCDPPSVQETSAWKLVGAYCAAAPVTVLVICSGPPVRMTPALIGSCGPAGCEPET